MFRKSILTLGAVALLALAGAMLSTGCSNQVTMPTVEELGSDSGRTNALTPLQKTTEKTKLDRKTKRTTKTK